MLIKRILTAIIGIMATGYIISYGEWLFASSIIILALLSWHELCKMFSHAKTPLWYSMGAVSILMLLGCAWLGNSHELNMVIAILTMLVLVKIVLSTPKFNIINAALTLFSVLYIGLSFSHLLLLRFISGEPYHSAFFGELSAGTMFIWIAFIGTWASDTFAFFVGSKFGKKKLCPLISPGKTIEGAIGGIAGSIIVIVIMGIIFKLSILHSVIIGLLVGISAPLGDLAESAIKRYTGVKDSGSLLPGHGGVLDRFDSIMFAVPTVYYYVQATILK
ncbi:phosphatidate cytidylyltransferase [Dendrosporobacter sp. 1207_IL3150]|uniref:phosphatidate cytidylyltransferase n=1 Tax=Dendrosporobacter sp. 1207_IL3150 TaxID=3084054 RepID=UPI002FDA896B